MKKTLTLNKSIIKSLIIGFITATLILFVIEHFGKFSYIANVPVSEFPRQDPFVDYIPYDTPLLTIYLETPFGSKISFSGNGFVVSDMNYSDTKFNNYFNKITYYFKALLYDYKFIGLIGLILSVLIYIFNHYKIKLN